jgi:hypothetical protein
LPSISKHGWQQLTPKSGQLSSRQSVSTILVTRERRELALYHRQYHTERKGILEIIRSDITVNLTHHMRFDHSEVFLTPSTDKLNGYGRPLISQIHWWLCCLAMRFYHLGLPTRTLLL